MTKGAACPIGRQGLVERWARRACGHCEPRRRSEPKRALTSSQRALAPRARGPAENNRMGSSPIVFVTSPEFGLPPTTNPPPPPPTSERKHKCTSCVDTVAVRGDSRKNCLNPLLSA